MCKTTFCDSLTTDMMKEIISEICTEEHLSNFIDGFYTSNKEKMELIFQTIAQKADYWKCDFVDINKSINKLLNNNRYFLAFLSDLQEAICATDNSVDYSSKICLGTVLNMTQINAFWKVLSVATKKCVNNKTIPLNWDKLEVEAEKVCRVFREPYDIFKNTFVSNSYGYNYKNLPCLGMLLHKNHCYKQIKRQKKQLTRLKKQANKIVLAYKLFLQNGTYFAYRKHLLPDLFNEFIRSEYYHKQKRG